MLSNNDKVTIPVALQIIVDDFGWHNGRDGRHENRPSRSGIPRNHAAEDYIIINEIGKALDMKVLTPFVIGEWDKDNLLRGLKYATYDETGWNRASEIEMKKIQKCFEIAENSEYIEYAYHALLHGYYVDGKQICETEYTRPRYDEKTSKYDMNRFDYIPANEMQEYIDMFFKIYDSWGFNKRIRSFVSPCGIHTPPEHEETENWAKILRKNGFVHWANYWPLLGDTTTVISGVTFLHKSFVGAHWDQYDIDPIMLFDQTKMQVGDKVYTKPAMGFHWTNFLRLTPENNMKNIDEWVKYFKRQNMIFGQMLSRDIAFAASQALYSRFGKLMVDDKRYTIDLNDVDSKEAAALREEFYISTKEPIKPDSCVGGIISLYEQQPWHTTYKIERINNSKVISFELV